MSLTKASFSMITGAVHNVKDYGALGDGSNNDTAAIAAAIQATAGLTSQPTDISGGILFFPTGVYMIDADSVLIKEMQSLTLQGEAACYSGVNRNFGTILRANSTGNYLIKVEDTSTDIRFQDMSIDGVSKVNDVLLINNTATGGITDFGFIKTVDFKGVKQAGNLIRFTSPASVYGEVAIWTIDNCGFELNGIVPSNLGTALNIESFGAWGVRVQDCHFDGQSLLQSLRLYAGLLYVSDCQFDNNSIVGTYDINMFSSAGLTVSNTNSGSSQPFLHTQVKVVSGIWDNYPIYINGVQCSNAGPPTNGIQHTTTNPIYINGFYRSNVLLSGVPQEVSAIGSTYLYQTNRDANFFASQKSGALADALTLASNDLTTFYEINVDSTVGVQISSYAPTVGYKDYQINAQNIAFNMANGKISILNLTQVYANNAAALAGGLIIGDVYRNGDALQIVHV